MKPSPIFHKTQTFLVWIMERAERFRKAQRFVMGQRIQNTVLDFHEALVVATKSKNTTAELRKADVILEKLRHQIRICVDLKLLTLRQYEYAANLLVEIGKLLGGWINSLKTGHRSRHQVTGSDAGNRSPCVAGRVVEQQSKQLPLCESQQQQPE